MSNLQETDLNLEDSGISEDDRREIAERIEAISQESRIEITPETFSYSSSRRSGVLPIFANAIALVLIGLGVLGAYLLFENRQAEISASDGTFTTAEGLLIAELRRQTAEELSAKDRAMSDVQQELVNVQFERDEILAEIDVRVRERQEELRRELVAELAAERERLLAAGASETNIQTRLAELQNSQTAENAAIIQAYRQELEAEYETNLARLQALQRQYEEELKALQQERIAISLDSEVREQEIRVQIDSEDEVAPDSDAAPPQVDTATQEALLAAQAELRRISDLDEQRALVDAQINGLYREISERVLLGEYPQALGGLQTLTALVTDPAYANLPGAQERLAVDVAVAATLGVLIRAQIATSPDRSEAEGLVGRLRTAVQRARTLAGGGETAAARQAYLDALAIVPEVSESHEYLMAAERAVATARALDIDASRAAAEARANEIDAERAALTATVASLRRQLVESDLAVAEARARIEQLETQSEDGAQTASAEAAALEANQVELEAEIAALQEEVVSLEESLAEARAEIARQPAIVEPVEPASDPAAQRLLNQGNIELGNGNYGAAISAFLRVVNDYPDSTQLSEAGAGIERTISSLRETRDEAETRLSDRIETLAEAREQLLERIEPLEALAGRYQTLLSQYERYTIREDEVLSGSGAGAIAEAKLVLDAFLTTPAMLEAFPELFDRFSRYQQAFEAEGRETAILELIDVTYNLTAYDTVAERTSFLEGEIERAGDGSFLADFLTELIFLVEG